MPKDEAFILLDQLAALHKKEIEEANNKANDIAEKHITLRQKDLQILLSLIEDWEQDDGEQLVYRMRNLQRFLHQASKAK